MKRLHWASVVRDHKQGVPRAANKMSRFDHKNAIFFFPRKIILCGQFFFLLHLLNAFRLKKELHLVLSDLIHKSVRMCSKNVKFYYEKRQSMCVNSGVQK